ncbi:unnamed protein product [Meganyctiphanes norvegica]|uniref:Cuticle protein n=1 Tax=Meganyctiphanes norvegica TaxID=48144 RepID=A0AAV2S6S2_MEGNR
MKILFALAVVGVAQCSPLLKNLPANAQVTYEYDGNVLEGIKIDYNDDRVVYAAPAAPVAPAPAVPAPAEPAVITYSAPAAPVPAAPVITTYSAPAAPAAPASFPTYYEVDDDGDFDVATHVAYNAPGAAPVLYRLPTAPAPAPVVYSAPAPAPVVYSAPTLYYTYESSEDESK